MFVRGWRKGDEEGEWMRSNMQKPWGTLADYHDAISGRLAIGVGAPSESVSLDNVTSPLLWSVVRAFLFSFVYLYLVTQQNLRKISGEKSKSRMKETFLRSTPPLPLSPSFRAISSAKCPTKIGICREYWIPEVRSGLSGKLLKVLRVLLISFFLSGKHFFSCSPISLPKLLPRDAVLSMSIPYIFCRKMFQMAYSPRY